MKGLWPRTSGLSNLNPIEVEIFVVGLQQAQDNHKKIEALAGPQKPNNFCVGFSKQRYFLKGFNFFYTLMQRFKISYVL